MATRWPWLRPFQGSRAHRVGVVKVQMGSTLLIAALALVLLGVEDEATANALAAALTTEPLPRGLELVG